MKTFERTIVLIPCWGRTDVVKFCKESLTRLVGRRLWVLSESDPCYEELLRVVSGRGDYVVEYRNQPLGMKLNAGIAYLMRYMRGWDYLMNWGSDYILDVAGSTDIIIGDLAELSSYGMVVDEDGNECVILVDYGITYRDFENLYGRKKAR